MFLLNILAIIFKIPFTVITIGEEAFFLISDSLIRSEEAKLLKAMHTHQSWAGMQQECFFTANN